MIFVDLENASKLSEYLLQKVFARTILKWIVTFDY